MRPSSTGERKPFVGRLWPITGLHQAVPGLSLFHPRSSYGEESRRERIERRRMSIEGNLHYYCLDKGLTLREVGGQDGGSGVSHLSKWSGASTRCPADALRRIAKEPEVSPADLPQAWSRR